MVKFARIICVALATSLLIGGLNANEFPNQKKCEEAYLTQVKVNYECTKAYEKSKAREEAITYQLGKYKNEAQRNYDRAENDKRRRQDCEKNKTDWLIRLPFTQIGITVPFAQGFAVGFVTAIIIL